MNDLKTTDFQVRVKPWLNACFGEQIANDVIERNHRFIEEALELVQACGCTQSEAHQLVDYVFSRPVGDKYQEVGGVMVTLAALCLAQNIDMHESGEIELDRIWAKVEQIRAKQAAKPKHSPLPIAVVDDVFIGVVAYSPLQGYSLKTSKYIENGTKIYASPPISPERENELLAEASRLKAREIELHELIGSLHNQISALRIAL